MRFHGRHIGMWCLVIVLTACGRVEAPAEPAAVTEAQVTSSACSSDPLVNAEPFSQGPNKGTCPNLTQYRALRVLDGEARSRVGLADPGAGESLWVANVAGAEGFYLAHIPLAAIERATLQIRPFKVGPVENSHAQLRVHFATPVRLYPQTAPGGNRASRSYEETEADDLIFSFQGLGTQEHFNPITEGMNGSLVMVGGLFTAANKLDLQIVTLQSSVHQYALTLTRLEVQEFVRQYVRLSEEWGTRRPYNALTFNSNEALLLAMESARSSGIAAPNLSPRSQSDILKAFERRGFLNRSASLPTWENDPSSQEDLARLRARPRDTSEE